MKQLTGWVGLHQLGTHLVVSQTFRSSNGSGSLAQKLARARPLLLYSGRYRGLPRACGSAARLLAGPEGRRKTP